MATSSHGGKATPSNLQPIYNYLNRIQEEFELQSNDTTSPRRFNIYLENLKGEFELVCLEIESLRKERDEYREKVEVEMTKLQDVRRNFVCERCSTRRPQIAVPSKPKTMSSLFSPFFRFESLDKLDNLRGVDLTHETTAGRSTQHMTLIQKLHSAITPTRPSQSISNTMTKCSETVVADSQAVGRPSTLTQMSAPTVDPDSDTVERGVSIEFNNDVEKKLDVEIAHTVIHEKRILCVRFSRDGNYLAAGCYDGKAYIYDVEAGTLTCVLRNLLAEEDEISSVCFSRDGKYLATGSGDGGLFRWEINRKYVRNAFKGHTRLVLSLDFSPNDRLLVSASDDNTVCLWNMRDGAAKLLIDDIPVILDDPCYTSALFSPDGLYVAASHRDGMVRMWSVRTGQLIRRVKAHILWANCVAFMPDGTGLVSGGIILRYWNISSLDSTQFRTRSQTKEDSRRKPQRVEEQSLAADREFLGNKGPAYSLAISPDGRWVASGSGDRSVRIWNSRNAAMQCTLKHDCWVQSVDFSAAGCHLASGGEDGTLRIWRYSNAASGAS